MMLGPYVVGSTEEDEDQIQSSHVIMVPWCQCCAARVPIDHICACELPDETPDTSYEEKR